MQPNVLTSVAAMGGKVEDARAALDKCVSESAAELEREQVKHTRTRNTPKSSLPCILAIPIKDDGAYDVGSGVERHSLWSSQL